MVAVDASVWLHRGACACPQELVSGQQTEERFLSYPIRMIELLQHHGVRPLLVFDGGVLPAKSSQNRSRQEQRAKSRSEGEALLKQGHPQEAKKALYKSLAVSPTLSHALVLELQRRNIPFVVAPYEADAQMAFLVMHGPHAWLKVSK